MPVYHIMPGNCTWELPFACFSYNTVSAMCHIIGLFTYCVHLFCFSPCQFRPCFFFSPIQMGSWDFLFYLTSSSFSVFFPIQLWENYRLNYWLISTNPVVVWSFPSLSWYTCPRFLHRCRLVSKKNNVWLRLFSLVVHASVALLQILNSCQVMKWKMNALEEVLNQILGLCGKTSTTHPTWEGIFRWTKGNH